MLVVLIKIVNKIKMKIFSIIIIYSDVSVLHYAIDSKNFETISIIIRHLAKDKDLEVNREVGVNKWTPLYRAGENTVFIFF